MNCNACRGACCETFTVRAPNVTSDYEQWVSLHGTRSGGSLTFECRCTKLTQDGRCGIYDDRPLVCRLFVPGSPDCLDAVRKRRTRGQFTLIREDGDPLS